MSQNETHTLQLWPSGNGYEYRGEPHEDDRSHRLRRRGIGAQKQERWRKGTKTEWAAILVEVRVNNYLAHEVLKCDSALVSDMLNTSGVAVDHRDASVLNEWGYDSVTNLYPDPSEWDDGQCKDWVDEHYGVDTTGMELTNLVEYIQDHAEPAEIYEWWAVTEWLAEQLEAIGECVLDNAYGYWWGRTCTGQAMKMDGTLQEVARRFA